MTSISEDNINSKEFENPEQLKEKLNQLHSKLPFILEEFQKSYILYNKDTENNEYQQIFETSKNNLEGLNSELFMVENKIHTDIDKLNKKLIELNIKITEDKIENTILKKKLGLVEVGINSTDVMIHNYKENFDLLYLRNCGMLFAIIVAWGIMTIVFKPNTNKVQPANNKP